MEQTWLQLKPDFMTCPLHHTSSKTALYTPLGLNDCPWPTRWEAFKAGWNQRTIARGWESPGSPKRCNPNRKGVFQLPFCWEALDLHILNAAEGLKQPAWYNCRMRSWNMNAEGLHQNLLCVHVCVWFPIVWNDQTEWSRITTFFRLQSLGCTAWSPKNRYTYIC